MPIIDPNATNYFLDTEFYEWPRQTFDLDFFSIGLVNENGQKFYGVYDKIEDEKYKGLWVYDNVIKKLPPQNQRQSLEKIAEGMLGVFEGSNPLVHIWALNDAYDDFVFCRFYGGMLPMRQILKEKFGIQKIDFRDTKELTKAAPASYLTAQFPVQDPATEHVSIDDADQEKGEFAVWKNIFLPKNPGKGLTLSPT